MNIAIRVKSLNWFHDRVNVDMVMFFLTGRTPLVIMF